MTALTATALALTGALTTRGPRHRRAGISVFSVLLGIIVAGALLVGVVSLYNSATESQKKAASTRLLNQLKANVEAAYAGSPTYGATSNTNLVPVLARRGLIPDEALVPGADGLADDTIRNPFGGAVAIVGNPGGAAATTFEVQFGAAEEEVCNHLGDGYVGRSRTRSGLVQLGVSGTDLADPQNPVATTVTQAAPFTKPQLDALCAQITAPGTVAFRFR